MTHTHDAKHTKYSLPAETLEEQANPTGASVLSSEAGLSKARSWWHALRSTMLAVLLALCFRIFFYEPFMIPTGSMIPTLEVGDYIFAEKFAYGYSRFALPWSPPLWKGRIFSHALPARGDVILFRSADDRDPKTYIKRIVGLPGDDIQVQDGVLFINHVAVPRKWLAEVTDRQGRAATRYLETLPNGVQYVTLDHIPHSRYDNTPLYTVPAGHYFIIGDNRDHSADSRAFLGYIPADRILGKAVLILFSSEASLFRPSTWIEATDIKRFFKGINQQPEPIT